MYAVECKYRLRDETESIAIFSKDFDANDYARMHNGEGGCILSVVDVDDEESLEYRVRVIFSYGTVSYPTGISFRFECEANAYAYRKARWEGGYLVVVYQI